MGEDSSLPESSARRLARGDLPVLTSGRGRETSPGRSLYGWAKFRLRTFSKNPPNSRTKGAECETGQVAFTTSGGPTNPVCVILARFHDVPPGDTLCRAPVLGSVGLYLRLL